MGSYTLMNYSSESGAFASVTGYSGYTLQYGSTALILQHFQDQMFSNPSPTPINIIASSSTGIRATLTNTAPSGSAPLTVALADNSGTGGSVAGFAPANGTTVSVGTPASVTGTFTASSTPGLGQSWSIKNTDGSASNNVATTGGVVNVYSHSTPVLAIASGNNQSAIINNSLFVLGHAELGRHRGQHPRPLDVNSLSNLTGTTGSGAVASGNTGSYTATGFVTSSVGVGKTLVASLQAGDQQTIAGASALGGLSQNVTYNVYNHAAPTLTVSGNNQSIITGGSFATATATLDNTTTTTLVNTPAPLDVDTLSHLTGGATVASNSTGTYTATGFDNVTVGLNKTLAVSLHAGDQQSIAGANALSTLGQNINYSVYDHASGSATGATIALPDSIKGYSSALAGATSASIANASGDRVNLKTTGTTARICHAQRQRERRRAGRQCGDLGFRDGRRHADRRSQLAEPNVQPHLCRRLDAQWSLQQPRQSGDCRNRQCFRPCHHWGFRRRHAPSG